MIEVIKRERGVRLPHGAVYVGRPSQWGNPYSIGEHGTREEVVDLYRSYLQRNPNLVEVLAGREPTALACWCAPKACHADVLAEALDAIE